MAEQIPGHIKHFIEVNKGKLGIVNGSNFKLVRRDDGGSTPSPSVAWSGFPDKYVVSQDNKFVLLASAGYAQTIFELLNWAMAHYGKEFSRGEEKEN